MQRLTVKAEAAKRKAPPPPPPTKRCSNCGKIPMGRQFPLHFVPNYHLKEETNRRIVFTKNPGQKNGTSEER